MIGHRAAIQVTNLSAGCERRLSKVSSPADGRSEPIKERLAVESPGSPSDHLLYSGHAHIES